MNPDKSHYPLLIPLLKLYAQTVQYLNFMAGFLIFCIFVHVTFAAVFDPFNPDFFFKNTFAGVCLWCRSRLHESEGSEDGRHILNHSSPLDRLTALSLLPCFSGGLQLKCNNVKLNCPQTHIKLAAGHVLHTNENFGQRMFGPRGYR